MIGELVGISRVAGDPIGRRFERQAAEFTRTNLQLSRERE